MVKKGKWRGNESNIAFVDAKPGKLLINRLLYVGGNEKLTSAVTFVFSDQVSCAVTC